MAGLDVINGDEIDGEDTADAEAGALSVYSNPNVQKAVDARTKLDNEYKKYYDDLTAKLAARQAGPSFSERMLQLSSAFFAPTSVRGFSGVMGNVLPVLQKQEQAQREGKIKREDALNALTAAQLAQRAGLANQDVTTALAMAKLEATANKPVRGIAVGDTLRDPYTGAIIEPPPPPVGTTKVFEGLQYTFIGGDQYDKNNWKVVK